MANPPSKRRSRQTTEPGETTRVERAIVDMARTHPELGQIKVAEQLTRRGIQISASGVRQIWQRNGLETTLKRLKALVATDEAGHSRLTPRQVRLLERGKIGARAIRQQRAVSRSHIVGERREQILLAAADCFACDGFAGTSLRDIAARIGLLPGSVYYFFRTKEELFLSVHERGFEELITNVEAAIARARTPWLRLEAACREHVRALVAGHTILCLTGASFFSSYDAKLTARLAPDRRRYDAIFKVLVDDLDLAPTVDRTLFRLFVLGAINWTYVWYADGKRTPDEIAKQLITTLRR